MLVQGMLGLGDNIHQRAVIKQLMQRDVVTLETTWPCIYHDMVGDRLKLKEKPTAFRTQSKNVAREKLKFTRVSAVTEKPHVIWYSHDQIKKQGSFLAAMCTNSGLSVDDFSMPVPDVWVEKARKLVGNPDKPIMVYRPLVTRTEWNGCMQRNPDPLAYGRLFRSIRDKYFVISIADLEPKKEWIVSEDAKADIEFHRGEMDAEAIAGLMSIAGLVFCSPGFVLVMAQSVGAPLVAVFGGHESARLYDHGSKNDLLISPIRACECFSKTHRCDKRIDVYEACKALEAFTATTSKNCQKPAINRNIAASI